MLVPRIDQVLPGVTVSIVLKADQPTGRQVSGTVRDVLTRGNHPRGVKVRLTDGRVGRVQSLSKTPTTSLVSQLDDTSPSNSAPDVANHEFVRESQGIGWGNRDIRGDMDTPQKAQQTIGLDAYIKPAKTKWKGRKGGRENPNEEAASDDILAAEDVAVEEQSAHVPPSDQVAANQVVTCPICEEFTGDEIAVAYHVGTHLD